MRILRHFTYATLLSNILSFAPFVCGPYTFYKILIINWEVLQVFKIPDYLAIANLYSNLECDSRTFYTNESSNRGKKILNSKR